MIISSGTLIVTKCNTCGHPLHGLHKDGSAHRWLLRHAPLPSPFVVLERGLSAANVVTDHILVASHHSPALLAAEDGATPRDALVPGGLSGARIQSVA